MSKQARVGSSAGSGLLIGGIAVVLMIAAGTILLLQQDDLPSDQDVSNLVSDNGPVPVTEADAVTTQDVAEDTSGSEAVQDAPPVVSETVAAAPEQDETANQEDTTAAAESAVAGEVDASAPSIDEVRLDTDGVAVIAGRAEPGAQVDVVVDGEVIASTEADSGGSFAAIGIVDASDQPRVLSLSAAGETATVPSTDEVIIAPRQTTVAAEDTTSGDQGEGEEIAKVGEAVQSEAVVSPSAEAPTTIARDGDAISEEAPSQQLETETVSALETENPLAEVAEAPEPAAENATSDTNSTVSEGASPPNDQGTTGVTAITEAPQPQALPEVAEVAPLDTPDAAPQIALLKSTSEGVELLGTAPTPPRQIQLDTIGYSDGGVVQLAGRASVEAVEVRVYLNNRSIARLPVDRNGSWRGDLPGIDAGVYTLRVDALDEGGSVTSRLETPFKREAPEVLAAAASGSDGPVSAITVQTGDTLWAIARDRYGEGVLYVRVFEANRTSIRDPDLIYPGQVFDLPSD